MEQLERIEQYIEGNLSGEELRSFERSIAEDTQLAYEVKIIRKIIMGIERAGEDTFVNKVSQWEKEAKDNLGTRSKIVNFPTRRTWIGLAVAAAITILILLPFQIFRQTQSLPGEELYTHAFSPYPDFISQMDSGKTDSLQVAMKAYEVKDYRKASDIFSYLIEKNTADPNLYIYHGISLTEIEEYEAAEEAFTAVKNAENPNFHVHADWFRALLYLKQGDKGSARPILEEVSQTGNIYSKKAQELLSKF